MPLGAKTYYIMYLLYEIGIICIILLFKLGTPIFFFKYYAGNP